MAGKNKMFSIILFLVTPNYRFSARKNINRLRINLVNRNTYTTHVIAFLNIICSNNIKRAKFKYSFRYTEWQVVWLVLNILEYQLYIYIVTTYSYIDDNNIKICIVFQYNTCLK